MSQSKYVEYTSRHIYTINANKSLKTIACVIQRSVRPLFSLVLLVVVVAILCCRVAIRNGFGSIYGDGDVSTRIWGYWSENNDQTVNNFQIFNSTLLELAEVELGEAKLREEIGLFLDSKFGNAASFRVFVAWRRLRGNLRVRTLSTMSRMPVNPESPEFITVWNEFRRCLGDWSEKNTFRPDILEDLVDNVKVPIDRHNGVLVGVKKKYSSCAVVGNSGILLSKEYGNMIDDHEVVIRLNNARIGSYQNNVGSKTNISFVNSNILHDCASEDDCFCHPYGANVPIVMYMCQPVQFLDYVVCNTSHKSPLIVTDPSFDMLCARIVKYYSLKRFANKTLEEWNLANDGSLFHYSSGMQAVTMALGMCDQVSLFGFGKSNHTKHHYHTNQTQELRLHDYEAEYDYYHALVNNPASIPFISEKFEFPPVIIHR